MTTATLSSSVRDLPLEEITPSPFNHRKHFDPVKLEQLAESIRSRGILQPLVVRPEPGGGGWQLVVGERRFRAAQLVGLTHVPCSVRDLDDAGVIEVQVIENLQRADVHPLEEAAGFRSLIEEARYDVARIAARVGRSVAYVYDRMKLLQLIPAAQDLFLADRFTAGHAVILARLKPSDQERAVEPDSVALWENEATLFDPTEKLAKQTDPYEGLKTRSVRELQAWVDQHVRFDLENEDLGFDFPETAEDLRAAEEAELKVVKITMQHYVQPEARSDAERTYGPQSWKRATKECPHQVTGIVVVGPQRGRSFPVCVEKKKCKTHWGKEIREAAARAKARAEAPAAAPAKKEKRPQWEIDRERREKFRERMKVAGPGLVAAAVERIRELPADATGALSKLVLDALDFGMSLPNEPAIPRGETAEDLVRFIAGVHVQLELENAGGMDDLNVLVTLGLDPKKLLDELAPEEKPQKPAAATKARKAPKKKGGRKQ